MSGLGVTVVVLGGWLDWVILVCSHLDDSKTKERQGV